MADSNDPICFTLGMLRFLGDDIASTLSERGWAVADPDVVPLEWFWPPTAPVGYGGPPEWASETMRKRPHLFGPRHTPWTAPTRNRPGRPTATSGRPEPQERAGGLRLPGDL